MNLWVYFPVILLSLTWFSLKDNAALAMIERSADAWEHNQFKDVIVRAANIEMYAPSPFDFASDTQVF